MSEDNQKKINLGKIHPLSLLAEEAYKVFSDMGFEIATGPELESEWYNFDVLNVPKDHPARDMQDTFFIKAEPGAFAQVLGSLGPLPQPDQLENFDFLFLF